MNPRILGRRVNATGDILPGIIINANNPNVLITGDPGTSVIELPDWDETHGSVPGAIVTDGLNTVVDGIRIPGKTAWWQGGVMTYEAEPTVMVKNSVLWAGTYQGKPLPPELYVNNITPDEWEAVPPPLAKPELPAAQIDALADALEGTVREFFTAT